MTEAGTEFLKTGTNSRLNNVHGNSTKYFKVTEYFIYKLNISQSQNL